MKSLLSRLCAAALISVASIAGGTAFAQGAPGGPGAGMAQPDPLNLTADQKKKVEAIQKKYQPQMMALKSKYEPQMLTIRNKYIKLAEPLANDKTAVGQKKQLALFQQMQKEMAPIAQKAMKESQPLQAKVQHELEGILDAKQKATFRQIIAQQKAMMAGATGGAPKQR